MLPESSLLNPFVPSAVEGRGANDPRPSTALGTNGEGLRV
ncbi:hypothetical protein FHS49_000466 [Sphingobium boeckii]|uniref:Uncharacterized protein n=1 Tax=Sphingobium boeckii TaxID=1082345 RepID=A0A7W9AF18_9SPHN|nr:hypothetical protein [Sphingobium boeckii]